MADDMGNASDEVNDIDQHLSTNHNNTNNCAHQTSHFLEFYILDVAKDPKRHKGAHATGRQKKKDGKHLCVTNTWQGYYFLICRDLNIFRETC